MHTPSGRFKRGICHCACLAVLMSLTASAVLAQGRVEVSFELPQSSVTASELVYVRFSIHNGLKEKIGLDPAAGRDSPIDLSVDEPDGSTSHLSPPLHGGLLQVPALVIPPNSSKEMSSLLNELYQFKKPGNYKLKIKLSGSLRTQSGKLLDQPPQELALSVSPRDPQRLDEVCKALAKASSGYSDYGALKEAATALSHVEDPVAIPYLQQVIAEHNFVSEIAVKGLVRIGSPEALRALESELDTPDKMLKMKIQGAIQEIKTGIHPQVMD